ncbi:MAG: hypothetical protein AB7O67_15655 [Vicinamibacterales bacterium]
MRVAAFAVAALVAMPVAGWAQSDDKAAEVVAATRQALGGPALDAVKSLGMEGSFRRVAGQRQMEGDVELLLVQPGQMRRVETMGFGGPGGPSIERTSTLSGGEAWDEVDNRGGGGGRGGMLMLRGGPGGAGPDGQPRGRDGQPLDEAALARARGARMQAEMNRWLFALLLSSDTTITYAGTAQAPDGTADVLEIKDERDQPVRLFVDQATHMPLMMTFQDIRPRMMMMGPGGPGGPGGRRGARGQAPPDGQPAERPDPEEIRRRMAEQGPPPPVTVSMRFADYQAEDGVLLPHRIDQSVGNEPTEELTVEKYKINPKVKAEAFEKKK